MAGKHYPPVVSPEDNPLYHDTYKLLRCYRDSTYSLKVAVRQVEIQFQLEYKTSIDEFLDSIYTAGADLTGSQIEEWAKSISRSNKMIKSPQKSQTWRTVLLDFILCLPLTTGVEEYR